MATRTQPRKSLQESTSQEELDRAAGALWTDAAKTAQAGVNDIEEAARTMASAEVLDSAGQIALGAGIHDLTRADDLETVASRVASLSAIVAESGAADVAQGAEMLVAADDVGTVSAVVGLMSMADLDRGMELARISGELQAASRIVDKLKMPLLSAFLGDRSGTMCRLAVDNILLASATRALAAGMAATGKKLEDLSANEVAEGIVRLAASGALADRSAQLAADSKAHTAAGDQALADAAVLDKEAGEARSDAVDATARGAAAIGMATAEAAMADALADQARQ
jgi:hypothetical protein